jgi:hypothetical protein
MTTKTRLVSPSAGVRALCMGRARLDAEPDGRRPSDGCALLGVVHASYQGAQLGWQASLGAPSRTRPSRPSSTLWRRGTCTTSLRGVPHPRALLLLLPHRVPVPQDVHGARVFRQLTGACFDIFPSARPRLVGALSRHQAGPRQERPAARGSGDWACLGDVPGTKWSPIKYTRLAQLHWRGAGSTFADVR